MPVDQLNLVKTTAYPPGTDPGTLHAGDTVPYQFPVTDSGTAPLTAAQVTDDLGDVLDDATYDGDASATTGTATVTGGTLTWTGDLAPGASATITYSVTVTGDGYGHPAGNGTLTNSATTATPGATCSSNPSGALPCTVTIPVTCEPTPTPPPTTYATRP